MAPTYLGERRPFRTVVNNNLERPGLHEARELALPLLDGDRGADHERPASRLAWFALHLLLHSRPPLRHRLVFEVRAVRHDGADRLSSRVNGGRRSRLARDNTVISSTSKGLQALTKLEAMPKSRKF